jgi:hypothetical protein
MGGLKEKLYNYFNQNFQNMFNRYMVTTEDEMTKKVRNYIDKEETKILARYSPKEVADLLDQVGGSDKFNTGEIEKSMVNMYGHLQGHIQRGVNELENITNSLLRQKTDTGAFIRGENAYSIVKCAFKDNLQKPRTVTDVKLSVNILDSELISPIFHYQATVEYLIKDLLSKHLIDNIDKEIEKIKDERIDQGLEELSDSEIIFKKMGKVENYTDDKPDDPKARRYNVVAKEIMDRLSDLRAEIDPSDYDQQNVRENLKQIIDIENIRSRGFNTAINSITSILDTSRMGYQYIENLKNARELLIREYEDTSLDILPDERYQVRMRYYDNAQLIEERKSYDVQMKSFETEVIHLWNVITVIYEGSKKPFRLTDFGDLARKNRNRILKVIKEKTGEPLYEDIAKAWDEISFVNPEPTEVERMNRTYVYEKDKLHQKIILMREKLKGMYDYQYPADRRILEDRLNFLEKEYTRFDYLLNPYHVQPGLLLDVDITSIKRKKATLNDMANVLNEFLNGVSKGFQDAAFASFSRRRSTIRDDISQSFTDAAASGPSAAVSPASSYLDLLNSDDTADTVPVLAPLPEKTQVVSNKSAKSGKSARASKSARARGGRALREV